MWFSSSISPRQRGPALIGIGLAIVMLAQFWPALPVVATIMLIAWGAMLTLHAHPRNHRQDALSIIQLSVYATLVCLAIVAQSHVEMQQPTGRMRLMMLVDHAAAIMLLLALAAHVFRRICQPLAQDG